MLFYPCYQSGTLIPASTVMDSTHLSVDVTCHDVDASGGADGSVQTADRGREKGGSVCPTPRKTWESQPGTTAGTTGSLQVSKCLSIMSHSI